MTTYSPPEHGPRPVVPFHQRLYPAYTRSSVDVKWAITKPEPSDMLLVEALVVDTQGFIADALLPIDSYCGHGHLLLPTGSIEGNSVGLSSHPREPGIVA